MDSTWISYNVDSSLPKDEKKPYPKDELPPNDRIFALPPLPCLLTRLPLVVARSYISNALHILLDIKDARLFYKNTRPNFWPEEVPFCKPGPVPSSYYDKYGGNASKAWHVDLKKIIYAMHRHLNQDFNKNISKDGWTKFEKKNKTYVKASLNAGSPYPEMPMELRQILTYTPCSSKCRPGDSTDAPNTDATNVKTTNTGATTTGVVNTGATNDENKEIQDFQITDGRRKCSRKAKGKRTLDEELDEEVRKPK